MLGKDEPEYQSGIYFAQKYFDINMNTMVDLQMIIENKRLKFYECLIDLRKVLTDLCDIIGYQLKEKTDSNKSL